MFAAVGAALVAAGITPQTAFAQNAGAMPIPVRQIPAVRLVQRSPVIKAVRMPLKHFVYIIQENISFDHYFGTYPGANGIPKGVKLAYRPGGPPEVAPFHLAQNRLPRDLNHSWQAAHVSADEGKMDGFLWGEWPQALAYYWKGPLPQIDPEDIVPVSDAQVQAEQQGGRAGKGGQGRPRLRARRAIARFDKDGDSTLDAAEIAALLATLPGPPRDAQTVLERFDADHNSQLDLQELTAFYRRQRPRGGAGEAVAAGQLPTRHLDAPPAGPPPAWVKNTVSYDDWHEIPNYWEYARRFTLCDDFFSSLAGPSEPNHLYTVAARSDGLVNNPAPNINSQDGVYTFPTMAELLEKSGVS